MVAVGNAPTTSRKKVGPKIWCDANPSGCERFGNPRPTWNMFLGGNHGGISPYTPLFATSQHPELMGYLSSFCVFFLKNSDLFKVIFFLCTSLYSGKSPFCTTISDFFFQALCLSQIHANLRSFTNCESDPSSLIFVLFSSSQRGPRPGKTPKKNGFPAPYFFWGLQWHHHPRRCRGVGREQTWGSEIWNPISNMCIRYTVYLEPVCPLFLASAPPKQGLFQSKQWSFGFQVCIIQY